LVEIVVVGVLGNESQAEGRAERELQTKASVNIKV
jgi:hypothetical protein